MKKDELVKDLENILQRYQHGAEENGWCLPDSFGSDMMDLLEAVLSRETAMIEEIEKPLKEIHDYQIRYEEDPPPDDMSDAIDEALSIIQRRKGGK